VRTDGLQAEPNTSHEGRLRFLLECCYSFCDILSLDMHKTVGVDFNVSVLSGLQREAQYQKERAEAAARAAEQERLRAEDKEKRLAAAQAHASSLEEKIALLERQAAKALARISPSNGLHNLIYHQSMFAHWKCLYFM
jgi:hypothetical protein